MDKDVLATEIGQDERVDILNLDGWRILDIQEDNHHYHIIVEVAERATSCPLCAALSPYRFGVREHEFADLPMHGRHVRIVARLQRYRCRDCHGGYFNLKNRQESKRVFCCFQLHLLEPVLQ